MSTPDASSTLPVHPRAAFQHRDFTLFQLSRLFSVVGGQMLSVGVAYQIYSVTGSKLDLGYVGLAQFLPAFGLALVTGQVADRFDRRKILLAYHLGMIACALALALLATRHLGSLFPIYVVLSCIGTVRAFSGPAAQSLMPSLVPIEHFPNAAAWSASVWQLSTIAGPAIGGTLLGFAPPWFVYVAAGFCAVIAFATIASMRVRPGRRTIAGGALDVLLGGIRYVRENKILLGAISLDLFAVLLGGAVALLPVFALDILHVGPVGFGMLRSAPAVGAAVTGVALAYRPVERRSGHVMFGAVAIFGVATVVFGASRSFTLSLLALIVIGASDMVSVFIRQILVQLETPDGLRGRVNAVNQVFVGASNELGEFESGVTAEWLGTVPSVIVGGVGTLAVVAIWAWAFPALRRADRLRGAQKPA